MLCKDSAIELKCFILNSDWYTVDKLSIAYVTLQANKYIKEYCTSGDTLDNIFTDETIAYCFCLLQGLN